MLSTTTKVPTSTLKVTLSCLVRAMFKSQSHSHVSLGWAVTFQEPELSVKSMAPRRRNSCLGGLVYISADSTDDTDGIFYISCFI